LQGTITLLVRFHHKKIPAYFMNSSNTMRCTRQESSQPGQPDLRIGFILLNQFTLIPVSGFVESLRFAADQSFRSQQIYCQWDWMTCTNQAVVASCGMQIQPTHDLENLYSYDYIVIAGGLLEETRYPTPELLQLLQQAVHNGQPLISLCSASFVLAKAGLLEGKRAAVHFSIRDEFMQRFPKVQAIQEESFIDDEGIITCPGGLAIDLATYIIRKHCGEMRVQKVLKYLLEDGVLKKPALYNKVPHEPPVYHNTIVCKAIDFMRQNMSSTCSLKDVADYAGTSPRQLHRAFLSSAHEAPAHYWRRVRLEWARQQLADTNDHVTTIAIECGFADASHFIAWFRKQYGETPAVYRKRRHAIERREN